MFRAIRVRCAGTARVSAAIAPEQVKPPSGTSGEATAAAAGGAIRRRTLVR